MAEAPAPPWHGWRTWPALAAAAALSILVQGFQLPGSTNAWHLPILLDWIGSAEGPDDAFTRSLERFATQVWPLLSLVADEATWPAVLALAHYLARLATLAALFLLLERLAAGAPGDRRGRALLLAALFGIGLAFFRQSPLGGGEVMLDEFSHSALNVPLSLLLLLCAARRRWWGCGLLLGLLFDVNAFVAGWLALATAAAFLAAERGRPRRERLRLALGPLALAALLALPTAWDLRDALAAAAPPPGFDFRVFLRAFYGGHFFLSSVPPGNLVSALLLWLGIGWLALWFRRRPAPDAATRRAAAGFVAVLLLVPLLGALLPALSGSALLLNLHPMRMDFLLVWAFYVGLGLVVMLRGRLDLPAALVLLALFAGLFLPLLLLLPLLGSGGADRAAGQGPDRRPARAAAPLVWLTVAAAVALLGALPALPFATHRWVQALQLAVLLLFLARGTFDRRLDPATALLAALLALLSSHFAAPLPGLPWAAAALLALAAGLRLRRPRAAPEPGLLHPLPGLVFLAAVLAAALPGARHLLESGRLDRYDARSLSFLSAQRWARSETAPGSLFLAPDWQLEGNLTPSFWTLSRRPVWVDWRQGAAVHWSPGFYPQWQERMQQARALGSVAEKLAFARGVGIAYVILGPEEPRPAAPAALYDDGLTAILPAAQGAAE